MGNGKHAPVVATPPQPALLAAKPSEEQARRMFRTYPHVVSTALTCGLHCAATIVLLLP